MGSTHTLKIMAGKLGKLLVDKFSKICTETLSGSVFFFKKLSDTFTMYKVLALLQNSDLPRIFIFCMTGEMRQVQISCDICTCFARYLYSTKQCWIINNYSQKWR